MKQVIKLTENELRNILKQVITETIDETDIKLLGKKSGLARTCQMGYDNGNTHKVRPNGKVENNNDRAMNGRVTKEDLTKSFFEMIAEKGGEQLPVIFINIMSFQQWKGQAVYTIEEIQQIDYDGIVMKGNFKNVDTNTEKEMVLIFRNDFSLKQPKHPIKIQYIIRRGNSPEGKSNHNVLEVLVTLKKEYTFNEFMHMP